MLLSRWFGSSGRGIRADSYDRSVYGQFWFEPVGLRSLTGQRVTPAAALTLPTVFACVRVLAESFSVMPFVLYRQGSPRTKVVAHWLHRLFTRSPNRYQTPFEWRLMLMGHLALRGNAYCQITANGRGEITELLPLHPDRMQIELLPDGNYRYKYNALDGQTIRYARQDVWHLRGLSSDGVVGMSPIDLAREAIGEGLAMQSYSARFFANDTRPGGWVEYPGSFADKAARQVFKESWQESYGGPNVRKVAVLEKGMKYHELALNNSDAQFIEARGYKVPEICRLFRVPPHKVADLSRATFSNIESQSIEFWTDTMLPWAECWESSIECFLLGEDTDLEVEFDMRRLMRGDSASRTAYYQGGIQSGWLTRNEAREAEGYDPLDGLDEPLTPLNMVEGGRSEAADDEDDEEAEGGGTGTEDESDGQPRLRATPALSDDRFRLHAILTAGAERLARRAAAALARKPPDQVFDDGFADLMAEALGMDAGLARQTCSELAHAADGRALTEEQIALALMVGATYTHSPQGGRNER
jgi:HK97 family phage portal protein